MSELEPQTDEHKWLKLAVDAHRTSTDYFDANIRARLEQDIRQFNGQHPTNSKYYSDSYRLRSKLFRNKTRAAARKNEAACAAAFFSTDDVVSIKAEDDNNPLQQVGAEITKGLLQYRLTKTIPWFLILNGAYQETLSVGVVCSHQYWDFDAKRNTDKPSVDLIPVENVRFDPAAAWYDPINTSPYVVVEIPMYVKDVRAKIKSNGWLPLEDAVLESASKEQWDSIRMNREGGRADSKDAQMRTGSYAMVWVHMNIVEDEGEDWLYYTLGTEHLLSTPEPLENQYWHKKRPLVMGFCILEAHKIYPSAPTTLTRDTQTEINSVANLRMDNVSFTLNKRYFVKRGRQVDVRSLTRNVPGSATLMQDTDDVKIVETNDVTSSSFQEQDRLNMDFDDLSGAFSTSSVSSNRKLNETVGGMNLLSANSNQVSEYQLRTFVETWVEPVLRQLMLLEQHYESDETILMLAANKSEAYAQYKDSITLDDALLQDLTLSVNVGIGATNPQTQVERFVYGMTSLANILSAPGMEQANRDEIVKELFGKLGYKDGARFFNTDGDDPRIAQMNQQIAELQQQLAQKTSPELIAAQVRKLDAETQNILVERVKKGVESAFAAMQAGQVVASIPEVAPIADAIMQSSGYQTPEPAGVDPNYPAPNAAIVPPIDQHQNTSPMMPPTAYQGIETQRSDSTAEVAQ